MLFYFNYSGSGYVDAIKNIATDHTNIGFFIKKITNDNELILVNGEEWDPSTLYEANRRGFMTAYTDLDDELLNFLAEDNYTIMVTHNSLDVGTLSSQYKESVMQYAIDSFSTVASADSILLYSFAVQRTHIGSPTIVLKYNMENDEHKEFSNENKDEYGNILLDGIVTDENGTEHSFKIIYPYNASELCIDCSMFCNQIIEFRLLQSQGDIMSYEIL